MEGVLAGAGEVDVDLEPVSDDGRSVFVEDDEISGDRNRGVGVGVGAGAPG